MKTSIAFFVSLICTASLIACAQPTAAPKPVETKQAISKPHKTTAPVNNPNTTSNKDSAPMIDLDNPPRGPAIPAAELKKQILSFIASLQKREHMSREHVEKMMGIALVAHPRADDMQIYFGQTQESWAYNLVLTYTYGEATPSIAIGLINNEKILDDALPKTCTLDFEDLAKDLVGLGYERGERPFRRRWGFGKTMMEQKIGIGIGVKVYRVDNGTEDGFDCIESIHIGMGTENA
jgi:hypothetical protein